MPDHALIVDAKLRGHTGTGALDKDIGASRQAGKGLKVSRVLEIKNDAPLAAVVEGRYGRMAVAVGAPSARRE